MKTKAIAILAVAATFFTAGYVAGDDASRHAVASDGLVAGAQAHASSPEAGDWSHPALPEGHPPVLPEGHPRILPEGHPPIPNRGASCPYSGGGNRLEQALDRKAGLRRPVSI